MQPFLEEAAVYGLNNSELAEFLHTDNRNKLSFVFVLSNIKF